MITFLCFLSFATLFTVIREFNCDDIFDGIILTSEVRYARQIRFRLKLGIRNSGHKQKSLELFILTSY
jgi:hypothetical protein